MCNCRMQKLIVMPLQIPISQNYYREHDLSVLSGSKVYVIEKGCVQHKIIYRIIMISPQTDSVKHVSNRDTLFNPSTGLTPVYFG